MHSSLTVYTTLVCMSTVFIVFLFLYVFRKRHHYTDVSRFFLLYTASIGIYCFGYGMGLTAGTLGEIKFWNVIQYIGMPASSPLGLLFIMRYLGIHVTKTSFWGLLVLPFLTFALVLTNDWHHLHYHVLTIDPFLGAPFVYQEIGPWYAVHGIYTFACMFVAVLLLASHWKETAKAYHPQLTALLFGQLLPMSTAFSYLMGWTPAGIDPVPMVLWLSTLLYFWAISSSRLFAVMPIAKDIIFNHIKDGVIVLDRFHRLIEFNEAAKKQFPRMGRRMFGMDFEQLWLQLAGDAFPIELGNVSGVQEGQATDEQAERTYQVRISPLNRANSYQGLLLIFTDVTELKQLQQQLEHQAYFDELTNIYNRRAFLQQSEKQLAAANHQASPFTIVLMDIDHFKKVNDTYGHQVGDELLVHVVDVCRAELAERDLFARYGGEEFVLALPGRTAAQAQELSDRLREQLKRQPLVTEQAVISVTLSLGVAQDADEPLHQLLKQADDALYQAKHSGRDQVQVYLEKEESVH